MASAFFEFTSASSAFSAPVPALSIFRSCTLGSAAMGAVTVAYCSVRVCVQGGARGARGMRCSALRTQVWQLRASSSGGRIPAQSQAKRLCTGSCAHSCDAESKVQLRGL